MAHCTNENYRPRKYGFGGGLAVGSLVGGYLGYKIGRAVGTRKGGTFDTEKKIGRGIKKTFSKKKKMEMGGEIEDGYKLYDPIIQGYEGEEFALDYARGLDWGSEEYQMVDSLPSYKQYVDTINGIDVYYDYGADYYFFVDSDENYAKGGGVGYKPMDRYDRIRYFMNNLGLEVDDIQPTDTSVGIFDGWVVFKKRNDKKEVYYSISYDDLWYYMSHNGTKEDVLRDSNVVDDDFFAEGGMTEHGLRVGDKIMGESKDLNAVFVKNKDEWHNVFLDKGKRYAEGGYTYQGGGEIESLQKKRREFMNILSQEDISRKSKSDTIKQIQIIDSKIKALKGGSTYQGGGGISDFGIGDKVMYDSYKYGTREGKILREIDDKHFEIGSGFGVSMVHKDKIIGYAPKRMFGLFEQGGNIDDIVAG